MGDGVKLQVLLAENGWFPGGVPLASLEDLMQQDFARRDMKVVPEFFQPGHLLAPKPDFLLIGRNGIEGLASASIVENDSTQGYNFLYVTKANVNSAYYGNGLLNEMVKFAAKIAASRGVPAVLRTSDERVSRKYSKSSDIRMQIGDYYIHGFGFQKPGSRMEEFQDARNLFLGIIAPYVAAKPATVIPINRDYQSIGGAGAMLVDELHERRLYLERHPFAARELGLPKYI